MIIEIVDEYTLENINLFADYSVHYDRNNISEQMMGRDFNAVVTPWRHGDDVLYSLCDLVVLI